jgi:(2R)-3-sulfolactate dehydrogenase (NADP+)
LSSSPCLARGASPRAIRAIFLRRPIALPLVSIAELTTLAAGALRRAGASEDMARLTAEALVHADATGVPTHGLSRLALYCEHLRTGRARGTAQPRIVRDANGCCLIDAGGGLAYEAMARAGVEAIARARVHGIAFVGVTDSHHAGAMAYHLRPVAEAGMVGLGFSNSPAAITAWGGKRPLFGTNPVAAVFPRASAPPLIIDLSLTEVVRGKIMLHAEQGKPIPAGWALDREGRPTTDARAALTGSLAAIGGAKGAMLALTVELLCCALTGAAFGFENDSYFEPGNAPRIGHAIVAIEPGAAAGRDVFAERIETLLAAMTEDEGVRLPGARRSQAAVQARRDGVALSDALYAQLKPLGG